MEKIIISIILIMLTITTYLSGCTKDSSDFLPYRPHIPQWQIQDSFILTTSRGHSGSHEFAVPHSNWKLSWTGQGGLDSYLRASLNDGTQAPPIKHLYSSTPDGEWINDDMTGYSGPYIIRLHSEGTWSFVLWVKW